ncbi:MAM and LDL-receptor class A domain-containing protein 2-like isoform X1 [Daphnia carinata]|uniref:MAM and LDL-receptor class A domain-containing protein 2-like isoform X1 n=1 Tax=Daphnia carinata TaxID=120202 RepID=UPI0028688E28|nr:MAM and LDL-receptor class A domain-containing protein 2-like isoform X1 [Daphnia carinata]
MVTRRNRMYPTFMLIIVIIAVSGAYSQQFGGNNSKRNDREPCSKVVLKNGKTKLRSSGRVVKFNCNRDYVLVGESTSTCLLGEWTSEAPVCATKGCPSIPPPPSGRFIASNGGAVMRLECNPGYRPSHSPMIYCVDRFDWNGTAPTCEASGVHESATRCDFENDDLCGWVQDTTTDEFDWTWQNYGTPSSHLSTGPSFDHTLGQGKGGHYLFIESSSPRILNDTARLFSPVYGPPESSTVAAEGVCFAFWFHMYGSTIGQLNVYVKPESKKMTELRPAFVRSGDQGDKWKQGYISLDRVTENFQVVIEGVRGNGYVGDSAIDDVQLAKGEECLAALKRMMTDTVVPGGGSTVQPSSTAPPNASCASRCSTTADQQPENTNTTSWMCGCSDDCLLKNSCCSDYAAFCLTGTSVTSTAKATTDERESAVTTTAGLLQTTTLATTTLATTTLATTLATTTTTQPPIASSATWTTAAATTLAVSTTPFLTPTSTASTTTAFSTSAFSTAESSSVTTSTSLEASSTTITRPTTRFSTTLTSTIPTVTTTTTSTAAPSTTTAIKQTTRNPTTTTTLSADTLRPTLVPTTTTGRTTSATTTSTTTRPTTVSTWTVTPSSRPTSTTTTSLLVPDDPSQDGLQGDDVQSGMAADDPSPSTINQTSSPTWFTGAVVAAAVGMAVLLMLAVAGAVMRSRRAVETGGGGLNGRRPRRPKMRSSHHQDQLAEDSDVRYLRDEDDVQLDLTEATPSSKSAASSQRQFADFERL